MTNQDDRTDPDPAPVKQSDAERVGSKGARDPATEVERDAERAPPEPENPLGGSERG